MNTALIFAAGRGLRLRPFTDTQPKPLCTINHIALIDYHLEKLLNTSIKRVLINHAYFGDQIKRHIQSSKKYNALDIIYIPEPPGGFQTGGTIINILPQLGNTPFLAINADIFTAYDFNALVCPKDSLAHLILIQTPKTHPIPDFGLTPQLKLKNADAQYTFSGIACYHPELFKNKSRGNTSLIPWLKEAADKTLATGEVYNGLWFDIGSPERLEQAREAVVSSLQETK
ncbi:MAG: nucleotidyltransferase family protein [Gammaproteobacteria bacterium]|nr:nucleotidyltransferase family protein [Gammaproteobacteria bacterium]